MKGTTKTYAQELPQYDWHLDKEFMPYVRFTTAYGSIWRYYPRTSVDVVQRDLKTLLRVLTTPDLYCTPIQMDGGDLKHESGAVYWSR